MPTALVFLYFSWSFIFLYLSHRQWEMERALISRFYLNSTYIVPQICWKEFLIRNLLFHAVITLRVVSTEGGRGLGRFHETVEDGHSNDRWVKLSGFLGVATVKVWPSPWLIDILITLPRSLIARQPAPVPSVLVKDPSPLLSLLDSPLGNPRSVYCKLKFCWQPQPFLNFTQI